MNLNATLVIEVLSFLILVWILKRFLYRPLLKFLDERSASIKKLVEETGQDREKAEGQLEESHQRLSRAKELAMEIRAKAEVEADRSRQKILERADREAKNLLQRSKEEIERTFRQAKEEIKRDVANLSVHIAEKILAREVKREDQERLINETLREIEG